MSRRQGSQVLISLSRLPSHEREPDAACSRAPTTIQTQAPDHQQPSTTVARQGRLKQEAAALKNDLHDTHCFSKMMFGGLGTGNTVLRAWLREKAILQRLRAAEAILQCLRPAYLGTLLRGEISAPATFSGRFLRSYVSRDTSTPLWQLWAHRSAHIQRS